MTDRERIKCAQARIDWWALEFAYGYKRPDEALVRELLRDLHQALAIDGEPR